LDVRVEYHHDHHHGPPHFAAALLRDGEPWICHGALIGMGATRGAALDDLVAVARYLVAQGWNALTPEPLTQPDREWLFNQVHAPGDCEELHAALGHFTETTEGHTDGRA
jgi:hypothetical protein